MTDSRPQLSPERFRAVRDLFDEALTTPPDERGAMLDRHCAGDRALREEVESLLSALDRASDEWEESGARQLAGDAMRAAGAWFSDPLAPQTRLGAYVVTRKVGEGGMGAVYEAVRDDETYEGRVAIKTLGRGLADPTLTRRLIRERQILARLQHPNIATLLDGGTTEHGLPYLVMEFVDGEPLDRHCTAQRLTVDQRLDLFRQACAAIQFAHRKLVIHRDLKPSNIMVSRDGVVKLLDFGIAKLVLPDAADDDGVTRDGLVPLTSAYASPEQARGDDITTATDVYSAGVVLYRLLAGVAPYNVDALPASAVRATLAEFVPPLPSVVATDSHARSSGLADAGALHRKLRGELDAIVMMALRKEPERRYASIEALSEDLHRYLKGLPVSARPDTVGYRVASFVKRRRAVVAGTSIAMISLMAGTTLALRQASIAREEAARATRVTQFLSAVVGAADPSHYSSVRTGRRDVGLLEVLDSTRSRVVHDLSREPRTRADLYWSMANAYRAFGRHELALMLQDSAKLLHTATVGDASLEVARDVHFAGVTLQDMGRADESVARFRDARARYLALPAVPDSELTDVEGSLGQMLGVALNQLAEGEQLLRSAEHRILAEQPPRHAMRGLIVGALAMTLTNQGRFASADSAFGRSMQAYAEDSVRARGERAVVLVNWGMLKSRQGEFAEAAEHKRRALADVRAAYGEGTLTEARIQHRLVDDLISLGHLADARRMADSALRMLSGISTPVPGDWSGLYRELAAIATREGRLGDATAALRKAEGYLPQLTGVARTAAEIPIVSERGRLLEARGSHDRAAEQMELAHRMAVEGLGRASMGAQAALGRLAAFYQRAGDSARADALLADSVRAAKP